MLVSAIVAMSENRVIGKDNQLPWHLPADLKHFKAITMGKPIVMGRKTYESIGRVLPGRHNIIITRNPDFQVSGASVVHTIEEALNAAGPAEEIMVIGGSELFQEMMPLYQRIYLTVVLARVEGDSYFPELGKEWMQVSAEDHPSDEEHAYPYCFLVLERKL